MTPVLRITFPMTSASAGDGHNRRVLVLKASGERKGRVIATFRPTMNDDDFVPEVVSPLQRQLLSDVLNLQIMSKQSCDGGTSSLGVRGDYCIAGMRRDQFVPLANELNSSSSGTEDSWRHYLGVAEQAAERADELGRQMIELGVQRDVRQEAAVEEVGELCGTYPQDTQLATAQNGQVTPAASDGALLACVSAPTIDIVFLREDPFEKYAERFSERQASNALRNIYCCNDPGTCCTGGENGTCTNLNTNAHPFCAKPLAENISHAGLGFITASDFGTDQIDQTCGRVTQSFNFRDPAGEGSATAYERFLSRSSYEMALASDFATQEGLLSAAAALEYGAYATGEWVVKLYGVPIMGTNNAVRAIVQDVSNVWPLCAEASGFNGCGSLGKYLSRLFPTPSSANRYAGLRRAVERALFYVGALGGRVPAGRITLPLPVANRRVLDPYVEIDTTLHGYGETPIPAPAVYGSAEFDTPGGGAVIRSNNFRGYEWVQPSEDAAMGRPKLSPPNSTYAADRALTDSPWRQALYAAASARQSDGGYLVLEAANAPILFDESLTGEHHDGLSEGEEAPPFKVTRQHLPQWLADIGRAFAERDPNFLAAVVKAGLHTPGKFSKDGKLFRNGRHICAKAHVSPVFYVPFTPWMSEPSWFGPESRGLFFTGITRGNFGAPAQPQLSRWFAVNEIAGLQGRECDGVRDCNNTRSGRERDWVPQPVPLFGQPSWYVIERLREGPTQQGPTNRWYPTQHNWSAGFSGEQSFSQDRLKPSQCPPAERVEMFLESDLPGPDRAMETIVRAIGLSCAANSDSVSVGALPPPQVRSVDDIRQLEGWVKTAARATKGVASFLFMTGVPVEVVKHVQLGGAAGATGQGDRGLAILELEEHLRNVEAEITNVGSTLDSLQAQIRSARLQIEGAELAGKARQLELALQRLQLDRDMALAAVARGDAHWGRWLRMGGVVAGLAGNLYSPGGGVSATATNDPKTQKMVVTLAAAAAAGGASGGAGAIVVAAPAVLSALGIWSSSGAEIQRARIETRFVRSAGANLDSQAEVAEEITDNQVAQVLANLDLASIGIYEALRNHSSAVENTVSDAQQVLLQLRQHENDARIALARATGSDFVEVNGSLLPLHLNTAYRRQFDVLKERYTRSLESAKRAAYMARLAIEERLGVRMSDLAESIGPLDPPSLWVEDVCTVQGVNYEELRTATANTPDAEERNRIKGFADQYVGDYVAKLREFVEFYNQQYPFHEADDVAIISLREDLQTPGDSCVGESRNLLSFSERLVAAPARFPDAPGPSRNAWTQTGCDAAACLQTRLGTELTIIGAGGSAIPVSPPLSVGAVTSLRTVARPVDIAAAPVSVPANSVYQSVELRQEARYVLSWWDQNWEQMTTSAGYQVAVYDSDWRLVAGELYVPVDKGTNAETWSQRRALEIRPYRSGVYHVAFSAGAPEYVGASIAIANVQLEEARGNTLQASAYEATTSSRTVMHAECAAQDPNAFRDRFVQRCDGTTCWMELRDLLMVDTELLNQGASSLVGKIAQGNYNYRHVGLAVNLVGSGVLDCSRTGSASCFGSSYVEYDLQHYAGNVPIEDHANEVRCFDFGIGNVRSAKALAAERYLSLPLNSTDREFVTQSPFFKVELAGRPLSGSYRLRIKDNPALVWERVEDVQLIVNYRYWSRVEGTNN